MAAATCGLSPRPSTPVVAPFEKCTASSPSSILRFPSASMSLRGHGVGKMEISRVRRTGSLRSGAIRPISAVAAPLAPPSNPLEDVGERQRPAEEYGFTQIGEPVPEGVTLKKIMDTFPPEVFEINDLKVFKTVAISVASYSLGLLMIAKAPWYLLPVAWAWTGTAVTGFFVIGHDCAHKSFSKNKLLEDIVGTIAFLPLIYPYEPWRFKHDRHHGKTNMLAEDTAWHPVMKEQWGSFLPFLKYLTEIGMGLFETLGVDWSLSNRWTSLSEFRPYERGRALWHFDLRKFRDSEKCRVKVSLDAVFAFMAIGWPAIICFTGIAGWFKFWLMPWLGYHFGMSTFIMVHHTAHHYHSRIGVLLRRNWAEQCTATTLHESNSFAMMLVLIFLITSLQRSPAITFDWLMIHFYNIGESSEFAFVDSISSDSQAFEHRALQLAINEDDHDGVSLFLLSNLRRRFQSGSKEILQAGFEPET